MIYKGLLLLSDIWHNTWIVLGNWIRSLSRQRMDYLVLEIFGSLPEYSPPAPWWRRFLPIPGLGAESPSLTMGVLRTGLERIAADPRTKGVVLRLDGLFVGWSKALSLRDLLQTFKKSGKWVVVYLEEFNTLNYFIACAADAIISAEVANWTVIGLRVESLFLKDALEAVNLEAEVIAVTPYKSAWDIVQRSDMSPEQLENLGQILDGFFAEIVQNIAQDRGLPEDRVLELINKAPLTAQQAKAESLLDEILYFDQIDEYLASAPEESKRGKIYTWGQVGRRLRRPVRWRSGKVIGIVTLEGRIAPGASRRLPLPVPLPFIGNLQAGSDSVAKALRQAERDPTIAALVFYIDSRGGSAVASDLIWREVARIRRKKPVVVFMDSYAASGGYYVSSDADWIVAQPLTITGSIGVVWVNIITGGLLSSLKVNRVILSRGARANLYSDAQKMDDEQHQIIKSQVFDLFDRFKARVAAGRKLSTEEVERLAGGKIWTGRQALEIGLVDELGDLQTAIQKAKSLAGLDPHRWTPTVWIVPRGGIILPGRFPPQPFRESDGFSDLGLEPVQAMLPFELKIR